MKLYNTIVIISGSIVLILFTIGIIRETKEDMKKLRQLRRKQEDERGVANTLNRSTEP